MSRRETLKRACVRALGKAAGLPGAAPILREARAKMQAGMNAYNPMRDDSAHQIAERESYRVTIQLIDRLLN